MITDVRVTIYDPFMANVLCLDAVSLGEIGNNSPIKYTDTPVGCAAAEIPVALTFSEVVARGYYRAYNIVEISTADNYMTAPSLAGATKIYLDANTPFNGSLEPDTQQVYFWDGATLTMGVPVTGSGSDSGGPYITVGTPMAGGGNPATLPAYGAGTYVGRRRYCGRIMRRQRPNSRNPLTRLTLTGLGVTGGMFDHAVGTFSFTAYDHGQAIWECLSQFSNRAGWNVLTLSQSNFPNVDASVTATLSQPTVVGATKFYVSSAAQFAPQDSVTIDPTGNADVLTIGSVSTSGNFFETTTAAQYGHAAGVDVTMPTGDGFTGTMSESPVSQMVNEILTAIPGDIWVVRTGHDRTPRLIRLYTSSTNSYAYNVTLPQGVLTYEPLNVTVTDEDASNLFNSIEVIGDTDPTTGQSSKAIAQDANSIALFGQVDAAPVTVTGLKSTSDCINYGVGLINESSLPVSNDSFRVCVRNDSTVLNAPVGISNGDVVLGVSAVTVTNFDDTGTVRNMIPDSEFEYTYASDPTEKKWGNAPNGGTYETMVFASGAGPNGSNAISYTGTGASATDSLASDPLHIAAGRVYIFSCYVDATYASGADLLVGLFDDQMLTPYVTISVPPGQKGRFTSAPFTVSSGVTITRCEFALNGATVTAGKLAIFSQPQCEPGSYASDYVANAATPNVYGLVSTVTTTIDPSADRYQDVKFAAVEPDWNAAMAERAQGLANALRANLKPPTNIDQYCISAGAYVYDAKHHLAIPTSGLVVNPPAFLALFAQGTNIVSITSPTFTCQASQTNWAWLNPDTTWTVKQDPSPVSGSILYGVFQTNATAVIGQIAKASIGVMKIGVGNINVATDLPAPVLSGSATVANVASSTPFQADISATLTLTNAPQDASAFGLAFFAKEHSQSVWSPDGEINLDGLPNPPATQTNLNYVYARMANGKAYDFAVCYIGLAGYGPLTTIATNFTAQTILVTTPYLTNGQPITPTIAASPTITNGISPNGVSAEVTLTFTATNMPTDGTLARVVIFARLSPSAPGQSGASGNWAEYGGENSPYIGQSNPSASASFTMGIADLTNGSYYDFGLAYEDSPGHRSNITQINSSAWQASTINLGVGSLPTIPANTYMTAVGSVTGYTAVNGGAYHAKFSVTPTVNVPAGEPAFSKWGTGFVILAIVNDTGTPYVETKLSDCAIVGEIPAAGWSGATLYGVTSGLSAGHAYQLYITAIDSQGNVIEDPNTPGSFNVDQYFAMTVAQYIGQGAVLDTPNLCIDSNFDYPMNGSSHGFNSSGFAGGDKFWVTYYADGITFLLARESSTGNAANSWLKRPDSDLGRNYQIMSEPVLLQANVTYVLSAYIDATTCETSSNGGLTPMVAIVSSNYDPQVHSGHDGGNNGSSTDILAFVAQAYGSNAPLYVTYTPTANTEVCVLFASRGCKVASSVLVFGQPMLQKGSLPGPYHAGARDKKPRPAAGVASTWTDSNGPADTQGGIPLGTGGGIVPHETLSWQVQGIVDSAGPNLLASEFPNGKIQPDGSLTNVNGESSATLYPLVAGQPFTAKAEIKKASGSATSTLLIGNQTNGYGAQYDGTPNAFLIRWLNGTASVVSSLDVGPSGDVLSRSLRLTVTPGSPNVLEASVGQFYFSATDSGISFTEIAAPAAPTLSSQAGGTLPPTTYYVKTTYVGTTASGMGETTASAESSLAVAADDVLVVDSPEAAQGALYYNVYAATATGAEELQASNVAIGTNWVMPTSGLVSGAAPPATNATGAPWPVTVYTGGATGILRHYSASASAFHRTAVHPDYQVTVNDGGGIDLSSNLHRNRVLDYISDTATRSGVLTSETAGASGARTVARVNDGTTIRTAGIIGTALAASADTFGSAVNYGQIHRLHLDQSGEPSGTNLLWNPTFANGTGAWTRSDSGSPTMDWYTDSYGGARLACGASTLPNNAFSLFYQDVSVLEAPMVISGIIECEGLNGVSVYVDVTDHTQSNVYARYTFNASGSVRQPFALAFTPADTTVAVRIVVQNLTGAQQSITDAIFYALQLEYGLKASPFVDHRAGRHVSITHQPTASADGSLLSPGLIAARHFVGGNATDTGDMVDSSSRLLHTRHSPPVQATVQGTADGDGTYLTHGIVRQDHIVTGNSGTEIDLDGIPDGRATRSGILTTETAGASGARTVARVNDGTTIRTAGIIGTALAASADTFGSAVNYGQIHRLSAEHSGANGSANLIYNPTFANGSVAGWTKFGNGSGMTWLGDNFMGGRLTVEVPASTSAHYEGYEQIVTPTYYNQTWVASITFEIINGSNFPSGTFVGLQVYDNNSNLLGLVEANITGPAYQTLAVSFTDKGSGPFQVSVVVTLPTAMGASAAYVTFARIQLEEGSTPSIWGDRQAANLVNQTHTPGQIENPLNSGIIFGRHLAGAPTTDTADITDSNGLLLYDRMSSDYQGNFNSSGFAKASTFLNQKQGSLLNAAGTPTPSYTATGGASANTATITLTVPATTYTMTDDVNTLTVAEFTNSGNPYSSLAASTTYYLDIAVNITTGEYVINGPNPYLSSPSYAMSHVYRDGLIPIIANYAVTTPAENNSGSGSTNPVPPGPNQGSCPEISQLVVTRRGTMRADEVDVGDELPGPSGWVRVNEAIRLPSPIWEYTLRQHGKQESFLVNATHAANSATGWLVVSEMQPGDVLEGGAEVVAARYLREGHYIAFDVDGHEFALGSHVVHNGVTL